MTTAILTSLRGFATRLYWTIAQMTLLERGFVGLTLGLLIIALAVGNWVLALLNLGAFCNWLTLINIRRATTKQDELRQQLNQVVAFASDCTGDALAALQECRILRDELEGRKREMVH